MKISTSYTHYCYVKVILQTFMNNEYNRLDGVDFELINKLDNEAKILHFDGNMVSKSDVKHFFEILQK